jgi:hypothetical protein
MHVRQAANFSHVTFPTHLLSLVWLVKTLGIDLWSFVQLGSHLGGQVGGETVQQGYQFFLAIINDLLHSD